MTSLGKALLFGVLVWLVLFAVAVAISPIRETSRLLFESIMPVAIALIVVPLGVVYFRRVRRRCVREGLLLGLLWLVMCVAIDAPLMLLSSSMQMTVPGYIADIGVAYLMIPIITVGIGAARAHAR
ncbi:MAG: hypothetical protein ACYSTY_05225 [Planctomycetota bacterium]|jgi:Na+/proline symporter